MTKGNVRTASAEDIENFYGMTLKESLRAILYEEDGEILGIGGVKKQSFPGFMDQWVAFTDIRQDKNISKMLIWRVAKLGFDKIVMPMRTPVIALCSQDDIRAQKFVSRLGFQYITNYDGKEVFQWN